ncbi:hypothetical protein O3P69_008146 [Scylla paramamosain]|uniref:Nucleoporin p58/p45 n=1 Tax=Scylla paramamosain TaxID=85552 RepID=A0AAW0T2C9_SCYPA
MMPGTNSTGGFSFSQPQTAPVQSTNKSLFSTSGGGFSFGTGTSQATTQPQQGGFSFGQPQTAAAQGTTKSLFGTSGGGFNFGTGTSQATTQPQQGTNSTGGFSFGQPQTAAAQGTTKSLFGTSGGGFSFGTGTSQATTQPQQGSQGFGTGSTTVGFSLGQPAGTSAPGSGFGFSSTTPAAPATTTSSFSFGLGTSTAAPAAVGFTQPIASIAPASAASTLSGFSFGNPPAAGTTTTSATPSFSFGLGGLGATSTPSLSFSGGTVTPAITTAAAITAGFPSSSLGLGGAQPPSASTDVNSSGSKTSGKSTKDHQLPPDLFATISIFESRKNAENAASEENIRQTAAPFHKIGEKAKEIQKVLAEIASDHLQLQANTSNLKGEVMKEAEHVEMAKRTKEIPMALQGDNKAPEIFFINLVRSFEAEMMYFRTKIEEVSQCMQAASNPCETEEDIAEVLQREHDTLKDLAAKVYAKHSQLVELSHHLKTKAGPNEQEFFRPQAKENTKTPASSVVRPVLGGGGSGLLAFQEQQQRAKAVTLGAAPPTLPLAHTTTPSIFSGSSNTTSMYTLGPCFGNTGFGQTGNTTFGMKPLFGSTPTNFGSTGTPGGLQQSSTTSTFTLNPPFNTKSFGTDDDDGDSRRKRRL